MLTEGQLREFGSNGYLVLPGVVAERLLAAADAEIDALVAESPPPADAGFHSYARPPGRLPACDAALRDSPAFRLAEALVSPRTLNHDLHYLQVALNIPPHPRRPGAPHLDGHRPEQARAPHHRGRQPPQDVLEAEAVGRGEGVEKLLRGCPRCGFPLVNKARTTQGG